MEHQYACKVLELCGSFGQCDIPNRSSMEFVARRIQTVELQYKERVRDGERGQPSGPASGLAGFNFLTADENDVFDGSSHVGATVCCAPSLVEHVSKELEREAQIQKQARKAREERNLARNPVPPTPDNDKSGGGGKKK